MPPARADGRPRSTIPTARKNHRVRMSDHLKLVMVCMGRDGRASSHAIAIIHALATVLRTNPADGTRNLSRRWKNLAPDPKNQHDPHIPADLGGNCGSPSPHLPRKSIHAT